LSIPQIEMMLADGIGYRSFLATCAVEVTGVVLPVAIGFGLVFPAVVDGLARPGRRAGGSVGLAYVVNSLGTTLGAAAAGFVLVPALGTQGTLEVAVLCIAAALAFSWGRRAAWLAVAASFAAVLAFPRWDWR